MNILRISKEHVSYMYYHFETALLCLNIRLQWTHKKIQKNIRFNNTGEPFSKSKSI